MKKRILAGLCAAVFALSAAGCGSSVKANETDTEAVMAAVEKFSACESFSLKQLTNSTEEANAEGTQYKYEGSNSVEISLITGDDFRMSTVTETEVKAEEGTMGHSTASYIISDNGMYTEYFSDGDKWYKVSTEDGSILSAFDARVFVASFYVDQIEFGKAGEDTLDGIKAIRYEGELKGEKLMDMLETVGYFNTYSSMSENQQAKIKANLEKDLGSVIVKVWVDEASGYPVRFEFSLTKILKEMEESVAKTLGNLDTSEWSITEYELSMTVSDFNTAVIELPEEAKSAQPYEITDTQDA